MLRPRRKSTFERVIIDVATQRDFLVSNGPMAVMNRAEVIPKIRALMGWVRAQRLPVISCMEAYRPADDSNGHPRHCIDGTPGQQKLPFTLLPKRAVIEADNSYAVPLDLLHRNRQVILRKRTEDLLANPKADRLLNELHERFIIFGVGLESWIRLLALGLMVRQKPVSVVGDACGYWDPVAADLVLRQLEAKGVQVLKTDELIQTVPARPIRRTKPIVRRLHEARQTR